MRRHRHRAGDDGFWPALGAVLFVIAIFLLVFAVFVRVASAQVCTEIQEACIPIYPHGFGAGGNQIAADGLPGRACIDYDLVDDCLYLDFNCNSMREDPPECCLGCGAVASTTSTSLAGPTTSTSLGGGGTTSTSLGGGGSTSTSLASTTSTSTSTTTSTTIVEGLAVVGDCFLLIGARPEYDNIQPFIMPEEEIVMEIGCNCLGECVSPIATIAVADSAGNAISTLTPLVCATGGAATVYADVDPLDPDRILAEGERLSFSVTNEPTSYDKVDICVRYEP